MFDDLRGFIRVLEERGMLRRVQAKVKVELEIAEIVRRVFKAGGPALLFEQVEGFDIPVLTNLFGTEERVLLALRAEKVEDVTSRMSDLLKVARKPSLKAIFQALRAVKATRPKLVRNAPCKEVVLRGEKVKLSKLPALKCWPKEAGRFITLPLVFTKDPEEGTRNVGIYRMQIFDDTTTGMHWQIHKHGALHLWKKKKPLEVAVALGGDPALILAASMPLPQGIDEVMVAGLLKGSPIKLVKCETVDLEVPAGAEIVLEGYVDPTETRLEGPFGDHTGYYSPPQPCHVFRVNCMTMREEPIYPAWVEGKPPNEGAVLQRVFQRLTLPLLRTVLPEVVDINFPPEACFHGLCIVSMRKRYPGHAKRIMMGLWGLESFSLVKVLVVVDEDVNVHDLGEVLWAIATRVDPARDMLVLKETPLDALDHSAPRIGLGSKVGIDATKKLKEEVERELPEELKMDEEISRKVDTLWHSLNL